MTEEKAKGLEQQISEALSIDETKLKEELSRQPSLFFYWSMGWALAARKRRTVKLKVRECEAEITREFRDLMAKENPSLRLTEKIIGDYIAEHPKYKEVASEQIKCEYTEDMLSAARDAFKQRGQALIELARTGEDMASNEFATVKALREELEAREPVKAKRKRQKSDEEVENG